MQQKIQKKYINMFNKKPTWFSYTMKLPIAPRKIYNIFGWASPPSEDKSL